MKIRFMAILISLSLLFLIPVSADTNEKEDQIKESLVSLGIDEESADELTKKYQKGETLDSLNKEFEHVEPEMVIDVDGYYEAKYVYPDKSVKIITIETPNNDMGVNPYAIYNGYVSGGNRQAGTYWWSWQRAKVTASWGVVTANFYADMSGSTDSGSIHSVYEPGIVVVGGTFSNRSLVLQKVNADMYGPAYAYLYFEGTAWSGFGQASFYLRIRIPRGQNIQTTFEVI